MNNKHQRTLRALYQLPTPSNVQWKDIESLMVGLGAIIKQGKGSAGAFVLNRKIFPFHKPHPQKEAKRYQVNDLKRFLSNLGITP